MQHKALGSLALAIAVAMTALVGCATTKSSSYPTMSGQEASSRRSSSRDVKSDPIEAASLNVSLGQAYLAKGQLERAMEKLTKAAQLNPKSSDAHTLLGVLYEQIGNDKRAEEYYAHAQKLTPEAGASNNNLGRFLCSRGRYAEADRYFQIALADPFYKNPETGLVNRAACAMRWGKREIAEETLAKALQIAPQNSAALLHMAQLSYEDGEYMRARAFLERHLSGAPAAPDTLMLGLQIETKLGDRRAVENYRRRLMTEFPDSEQAASAVKATHTP